MLWLSVLFFSKEGSKQENVGHKISRRELRTSVGKDKRYRADVDSKAQEADEAVKRNAFGAVHSIKVF